MGVEAMEEEEVAMEDREEEEVLVLEEEGVLLGAAVVEEAVWVTTLGFVEGMGFTTWGGKSTHDMVND